MFGIIMVPNAVHAEGYTTLSAIENIKMTRLVLYEERLDKLHKKCSRLLRDVAKKLGTTRRQFPNIASFTWNASEYSLTSIEELALLFEQKVLELTQTFVGIKTRSDEARLLTGNDGAHEGSLMDLDLNRLFEPEEYEFIDCFYCVVERRVEKVFRALFDLKSIVLLKKDNEFVLYKIYCLKKDSDSLFGSLSQKYTCRRVQKHSSTEKTPLEDAAKAVEKAEREFEDTLDRIVDIELHIALLKVYTESLHCFGLPPEFKYKLVKDAKKELRKLVADNRHLPRTILDSLPLLNVLEFE